MKYLRQKLLYLLSVLILAFWGCSGCNQVQKVQTATPASVDIERVHSDIEEPIVLGQPPKPADLAIGNLKTPEILTQRQIGDAFSEAVMVAATHPRKAEKRVHEIAYQLGAGDPEWTEYFHLLGHSLIEDVEDPNLYMTLEDALRFQQLTLNLYGEDEELRKEMERTRLQIQWNEDTDELNRQIQPVKDLLEWMSENAPTEWAIVAPIYEDLYSAERNALIPKDWLTDFLTPSERADIRYRALFEALSELPDDSITFQEWFHSDPAAVQETFVEERRELEASAVDKPPSVPIHTWDMSHDSSEPSNRLMPSAEAGEFFENSPQSPHTTPTVETFLDEDSLFEFARELEKQLRDEESFIPENQEQGKHKQVRPPLSPRNFPQTEGVDITVPSVRSEHESED